MSRTTVVLPEDLRLRAKERARRDGMSFAELVRQAVEARVGAPSDRTEDDPLFGDIPVFEGVVPGTLSENHDAELYGEPA
jgi:hypothetical protein